MSLKDFNKRLDKLEMKTCRAAEMRIIYTDTPEYEAYLA